LSSIFPNIVLLPWLISDISHRKPNLKTPFSRGIATTVALSGFLIPVFGGKPIAIMIASQAFSPVMMPLLIVFLIILLNKKSLMGENKIGIWMNVALGITLLFSLYMLVIALVGYVKYFV
jgi:Mn2+/Fe2+ NRAMP family transporter